MAVILTILKIIGIILLVILGILVLLLLLILFVPIRYSLSGDYKQEQEPHAQAWVKYLFPLVSVKVRLNPPEDPKKAGGKTQKTAVPEDTEGHKPSKVRLEGGVRILGIRIMNFFPTEEEKETARIKKEKKLAKKAAKEAKSGKKSGLFGKKKKGSVEDEIAQLEAELKQELEEAKTEQASAAASDNAGTKSGAEDEAAKKEKEKKALLETIRLIALAMPDNVAKALDKLCELMDKMDKLPDLTYEKTESVKKKLRKGMRIYRRVLWVKDKDYTGRALVKIKKCVIRILKSICPKKGHVKITAGMEDIATTGQIAGYYGILYGMFYPFIGKHVVLEPDFENKRMEADGWLKGRIRLYIFVPAAWLYFIDKDVKNFKKAIQTVQDEMH